MKFLYIIFFISFSNIGFSQDYKFDILTNYLIRYNESEQNSILFSNKNDSNYFLSIGNYTENTAYITDLRNKKVHYLLYKKVKSNVNESYEFSYLKTEDLVDPKINVSYVADFETTRKDSVYKIVKMTLFKNNRKKNIVSIKELTIKNYPKKLFPLYRFSCMHPLEQRITIDYGETGIVESSRTLTGIVSESKLEDYQEIDLTVSIPKKL